MREALALVVFDATRPIRGRSAYRHERTSLQKSLNVGFHSILWGIGTTNTYTLLHADLFAKLCDNVQLFDRNQRLPTEVEAVAFILEKDCSRWVHILYNEGKLPLLCPPAILRIFSRSDWRVFGQSIPHLLNIHSYSCPFCKILLFYIEKAQVATLATSGHPVSHCQTDIKGDSPQYGHLRWSKRPSMVLS